MTSIEVKIGKVVHGINPEMTLGIIEGNVINSSFNAELWKEIQDATALIRQSLSFEAIKDQPQVSATRKMYSLCGKDPSRYRPSAEALMRRIVKGKDLYQINTLVDIINLVSMKSGFSIGGFDERTSIRLETTHILWVIYAFAGTDMLEKGNTREVVFPKGKWRDKNGNVIKGPVKKQMAVALDDLLYFIKD